RRVAVRALELILLVLGIDFRQQIAVFHVRAHVGKRIVVSSLEAESVAEPEVRGPMREQRFGISRLASKRFAGELQRTLEKRGGGVVSLRLPHFAEMIQRFCVPREI